MSKKQNLGSEHNQDPLGALSFGQKYTSEPTRTASWVNVTWLLPEDCTIEQGG